MTKRVIIWLLLTTILCSIVVSSSAIPDPNDPVIQEEGTHIVLYKVHRGDRQSLATAINDLRNLAKEKKIETQKGVTLVALNSPFQRPDNHILTEIRIRVSQSESVRDEVLPEMTGIKRVPACEMAVLKNTKRRISIEKAHADIRKYVGNRGKVSIYGPQETFVGDFDADRSTQIESNIKIMIWE